MDANDGNEEDVDAQYEDADEEDNDDAELGDVLNFHGA